MKILYVTTVGVTMLFFEELIAELLREGHTVEIACNDALLPLPGSYAALGCPIHRICCTRSPADLRNLRAVGQIRRLVEKEGYDLVHCHTPVAAVCTRIACRPLRRKTGVKVVYTAHGFHFYRGAPLKNWILFYPVEKLCARWTDLLIVIDQEDLALARRRMHPQRIAYVPGVGIDTQRFAGTRADRAAKRRELGVPEDALMLLSVGELIARKDHRLVIGVLAQLPERVHYVIVGRGPLYGRLRAEAERAGVAARVHFPLWRTDIDEICAAADLFVFPSRQEGLPVALMEAMASGLPCAASAIRGNTELIDAQGGCLFRPGDAAACRRALEQLLRADWGAMGRHNREKARRFDRSAIHPQMKALYASLCGGGKT